MREHRFTPQGNEGRYAQNRPVRPRMAPLTEIPSIICPVKEDIVTLPGGVQDSPERIVEDPQTVNGALIETANVYMHAFAQLVPDNASRVAFNAKTNNTIADISLMLAKGDEANKGKAKIEAIDFIKEASTIFANQHTNDRNGRKVPIVVNEVHGYKELGVFARLAIETFAGKHIDDMEDEHIEMYVAMLNQKALLSPTENIGNIPLPVITEAFREFTLRVHASALNINEET